MKARSKQLSNSFSTGGGGSHFEAHVQASYLTLMLSGGYAPCLPCWPIVKIKLQGKVDGYDTDDLIVFVENPANKETRKLLGQVKHTIQINKGNSIFSEVIQAAWNDFNNPTLFTKDKDIFALITGPINKTDFINVQWLLNFSRNTIDSTQFYRYVKQANFRPSKSDEKLEVFRSNLKQANRNKVVSDDILYSFLKHFYLVGYDLGAEEGVVLSLLHSHISQFKKENPQHIWARIVEIIQTRNQYAGTLTPQNIPEDIKDTFKQPIYEHIPQELLTLKTEIVKTHWSQYNNARDLALINMIGAWNENNGKDIYVLNNFVNKDFVQWIPIMREILNIPESKISLYNGFWEIKDRIVLWDELGSRIFDTDIDLFKDLIINILSEKDPSFDRPTEDRFFFRLKDKTLRYSSKLRKGIAEGLAMLGNRPNALVHCSRGKAESCTLLAIREIFKDEDWKLWSSLNELLPILAEACPLEFLSAVERNLSISPSPFDELFSQESNGISGSNHMTGLLWALEALAWDEDLLVRVCVILGNLTMHDPGGNWLNRPINSLSSILLPWMPQTLASFEKQKVAIETLYKEQPKVAWDLLIRLLPNSQTMATGTHKPSWRSTIPKSLEVGVVYEDYWNQISAIAEIAVSIANYDVTRLCTLIEHLNDLPRSSFNKLLEVLSKEPIKSLPEDERLEIWHRMISFTSRHRKFHDEKWALDSEVLSLIEEISNKLAPKSPMNLYKHLFSDKDSDLYEENDNWEEQSKKLDERRQKAIIAILDLGGLKAVLTFSETVNSPNLVGNSLGAIANSDFDSYLLPGYLDTFNKNQIQFIAGYVWSKFYKNGLIWVDGIDKTEWTVFQISQFLMYLPFHKETWERVLNWLGKEEVDYWGKINANPYQAENDLGTAIDKFLSYGRPHMAIQCLSALRHRKQQLDKDKIVTALIMTVSLQDSLANIDYYDTVELIKILQEDPIFDEDQLFKVEWAYLQFLDHHHGAFPKLLETRLATNPDFFCEVVRILYRSKNEDTANISNSEESKKIAMNVWRLLRDWKTPPGTKIDGSFDDNLFLSWLKRVKESCLDSGHWEVAQVNIGEVLVYCPADQNGLWINCTVADALNSDDANDMRNGFRTAFFNSRGAHYVDPTGKPEKDLAENFRQKADDVERNGFYRLAITLRELADNYDRDAEKIIEESMREEE